MIDLPILSCRVSTTKDFDLISPEPPPHVLGVESGTEITVLPHVNLTFVNYPPFTYILSHTTDIHLKLIFQLHSISQIKEILHYNIAKPICACTNNASLHADG